MSSLIILLRSGTGFWLSAMGENLELGTGLRVLVVEERKRMKSWVKMQLDWSSGRNWLSVSVFMMDGLYVIFVLWNVATLKHESQH